MNGKDRLLWDEIDGEFSYNSKSNGSSNKNV